MTRHHIMDGSAPSRQWPRRLRVAVLCTEEPEDLLAMQIIYCLRQAGMRVYVISDGKEDLYKYSRYVSKYVVAPFPSRIEASHAFSKWLGDYVTQNKIDVIIGSDIFTVKLASQISTHFDQAQFFPAADLKTIETLDSKWSFFHLLKRAHLPTPETLLLDDWSEAERKAVARFAFPVMTKPLALSGGRGIIRFDTFEQLDNYLKVPHQFNNMPLLVQRYCPGKDIGLAFLADRGRLIAHSVQTKEKTPGYGESIQFLQHDEVVSIGERVIAETGYTGAGFIDMRIDDQGKQVHVLEFNPRLWFSVAVAMWLGCNYVEAGLRLANGLEYNGQRHCKLGTFYSFSALRARGMFRPAALGSISKDNLKGVWMEKSDLLVPIYRRIRNRMSNQRSMSRTTSANLFWQSTKSER